jgi:hypothetical protein
MPRDAVSARFMHARAARAGLWAVSLAAPCAIVTAALAAGLPPGHTPRSGRYAGPSGEPVSFRVSGGHVRSLRMHTSCGVYTVASTAVSHGDFQARTGPADRPLQLYGRFTTRTRAEIDWSVGYTATVTPTCLLHDTWTASRRGA